MLIEKCHADGLSAADTALESRKNKLQSRLYCSLPPASDPESTQAMPQPYPRATLAMYHRDENNNAVSQHAPTLTSSSVYGNRGSVVVAMKNFKNTHLEN